VKVLSVWDQRISSEDILEQLLIDADIELESFVRELDINTSELKPWLTFQKTAKSNFINKHFLIGRLLRLCSFIRMKKLVNKKIETFQPDILLCHFGQTGARFIKKAKKNKLPFVVIFYGHDISAALRSRRWRFNYRQFKNLTGTIIVLCVEAKQRLVQFGCRPESIVIWNLPLRFDFSIRDQPEIFNSPLQLVTAGRFVEKKGYPTLFAVIKKLRVEGINVILHAFGYGADFERIETMAREADVIECINWHRNLIGQDFKEKYITTLRNADLFLLASEIASNGDDEGGPALTLVIAQALGIPVVTTAFPGHEVTVVDGVTGFICEEPIVDNMVDHVRRLCDEFVFFQNVGKAGAIKAREEFDENKQTKTLIEILKTTSKCG